MPDKSIKVIGANKYFGKTQALCNVSIECNQGEIITRRISKSSVTGFTVWRREN